MIAKPTTIETVLNYELKEYIGLSKGELDHTVIMGSLLLNTIYKRLYICTS